MSQSYEGRRQFAAYVLETSFFGAYMTAIAARKGEQELTQNDLAERTGRDKTGISKLLSGPRNWTIKTISDLAEALDLRVEFKLVDLYNPIRQFTPTGVMYDAPSVQIAPLINTNTAQVTAVGNVGIAFNAYNLWSPSVNMLTGTGMIPAVNTANNLLAAPIDVNAQVRVS